MDTNLEQAEILKQQSESVSVVEVEKTEVVKNLAYYNKILTPYLKAEYFERNPYRLGYFTAFILGNLGLIFLALNFEMNWLGKIALGFCMGFLMPDWPLYLMNYRMDQSLKIKIYKISSSFFHLHHF